MRFQREQLWWLGACAAGLALTALAGGIIGPEVALFALVALAGWLLIRYEGPTAVAGPPLPPDNPGVSPEDSLPAAPAQADLASELAENTDESGEADADTADDADDEETEDGEEAEDSETPDEETPDEETPASG